MGIEKLEVGDHLSSPRTGYSHHGLYLGNGNVIHYTGLANGMSRGSIDITSVVEFASGNDVNVVNHTVRTFNRLESIERAHTRLGEDWYEVLTNNCEHFVNWCILGVPISHQVNRATLTAFAVCRGEAILAAARTILQQGIFHPKSDILTKKTAVEFTSAIAQTTITQAVTSTVTTQTAAAAAAGITAGGLTAGLGTGSAVAASLIGASGGTLLVPVAAASLAYFGVKKALSFFSD